MTQLTINGTEYPWVDGDNYQAYPSELGKSKRTIGGRLVTEIRGYIWVIKYSYDYMGNDLMRTLLQDLRNKTDLDVDFLVPDTDEMLHATFRCTSQPAPSVAFDYAGVPMWHNISFILESVEAVTDA